MTSAYDEALERVEAAKRTGARRLRLDGGGGGGLGSELRLTDGDLVRLWPQLGRLSNLTLLTLHNNELTALPANFGRLSSLTDFHLYNNKLKELPADFGRLSNLTILYLHDNELMALPASMQQLSKLEQLYLHGNPALNIPPEILGTTSFEVVVNKKQTANPQDILRYYFEQSAAVKRPLNEAKLLLLGQGDVGKTSLVKRLLYNTFDPHEGKTDGIQIEQWAIPNQRTPDQDIRVNVWDFGGQEIMHATHQFFLTERSLYLIVLKARREVDANRLDYWLQKVNSYGGDSPVLVVLNQIDQHAQELDTRFYEEKYPNLIVGWHKTSCVTGAGITELRRAIHTHINAFEGVHTPFAHSWFAVKTAIEQMPDNYITRDQYATICHDHDVRDPDNQRILLRFMHDLGIALNFDTLELKETHVLNPHWVTRGVYAILNDTQLAIEKGVLTHKHLRRILPQPAYRNMHGYIVHIMQQFELCFPTPHNKWLIPDLVSPAEPDTGRWEDVLHFRYHYPKAFEPSVMTRFITRMHDRIPNETFWRTGTILKEGGNRAHIRADRAAKQINIRIQGHQPTRRALLALIRDEFRKIHATIPNLIYQERVPLPDKPAVDIGYNFLLDLEQSGEIMYRPEGSEVHIAIGDLLNGIEDYRSRVRRLEHELQGGRGNASRSSPRVRTRSPQTQRKQLFEALCDAYDEASLKRMLSFELDKRLANIASGKDLKDLVFNLIEVATKEGWLDDLVEASANGNQTNYKVQKVAKQWIKTAQS